MRLRAGKQEAWWNFEADKELNSSQSSFIHKKTPKNPTLVYSGVLCLLLSICDCVWPNRAEVRGVGTPELVPENHIFPALLYVT